MKKLVLIGLFLPLMVLAQNPTEVPRPATVPSDYDVGFLRPDFNSGSVFDFDGDGKNDVVINYSKSATDPKYFQFYSYAKKQTIVTIQLDFTSPAYFDDIDGDSITEMVIWQSKKILIYEITGGIDIKKKLP